MDWSDKNISSIYKNCMIKRSQLEKQVDERIIQEMDKNFWGYLGKRLDNLVMKVVDLYQMPGVSKAQLDEAEKGVSNLINMVQVYTLPEVIEQLTRDLQQEKNLILIKLKEKNP